MARRGENRSGNGGESREYKVPPEYEGVVNAAKNIFGSREKSEDVIFSFDDDISELVGIIKIIYSENSGRRARNREVGAVKKVFEEAFDAKYSATSYKEKKERYLYDLFVAAAAEAGRGEVPAAEREKLGRVESAWQELKATFSASRDIPLGNRELSDPDVIKLIAVIEDIYNAHPKDNRRDRNARRNEVEAVRENYKQRLDANFSEEGNTQAKAKYLAEVFLVAESEVMARGTAEEEDETSEAVRELEESEEYKRDMATAESALYDAWKNEGESYVSAAVDAVRNVVRTIRANARKKDQDKVIEVAKERLTTAIVEKYASLDDEPEAIAEVIGRIFAVVEGEKKERKPKAQKESGPDYLKAIVDPIQQLSYEGFKSFSSNGSYQGTGEDIEAVREIFNALANEGKKTPKEIERAKRMLVDPLELLESQIEGDGSPKDYIDFLFLVAQEGEWSPRVQAQYETDKLRERVLRLQIEQANTASTRSREVAELSSILESLEEEDGDKVLDKIIVGLAEALEKKQNIREEDFDKLAAAITPFLKDAGFRRPKETSGEPEFECTIDARQLVVNAAQTLQYQKEQRYAEQVKDKKRAMLAKMGISSVAMATSFAFPPIGIGIGLALAGYNMGERGVQLRKRTKNEAQESRNLQLAAKMKHGNIYEDSREAVASLIAGEARRRLDVEIFRDEDVEINEEALTVLGKVMEGKTLDKNEQSLHTKIQTMVINKAEGDEKRVDEDGQLVDKTEAEKALDVRFLMNDLYLAGVEQSRSQQALKKFKHFETATEKARKEFMRSGLLIAASQGLRAAVPVIGLMAGGLATATSLGLGGASAALGGAGGWKLGGAAAELGVKRREKYKALKSVNPDKLYREYTADNVTDKKKEELYKQALHALRDQKLSETDPIGYTQVQDFVRHVSREREARSLESVKDTAVEERTKGVDTATAHVDAVMEEQAEGMTEKEKARFGLIENALVTSSKEVAKTEKSYNRKKNTLRIGAAVGLAAAGAVRVASAHEQLTDVAEMKDMRTAIDGIMTRDISDEEQTLQIEKLYSEAYNNPRYSEGQIAELDTMLRGEGFSQFEGGAIHHKVATTVGITAAGAGRSAPGEVPPVIGNIGESGRAAGPLPEKGSLAADGPTQTTQEAELTPRETDLSSKQGGEPLVADRADGLEEPSPTVAETLQERPVDSAIANATVQKGEGIEHAFQRQFEKDPELAKAYGWDGKEDIETFADKAGAVLARKAGYVSADGKDIRVGVIGKAAYVIEGSKDDFIVREFMDGAEQEVHTKDGAFKFEGKDHENYEYVSDETSSSAAGDANAAARPPTTRPHPDGLGEAPSPPLEAPAAELPEPGLNTTVDFGHPEGGDLHVDPDIADMERSDYSAPEFSEEEGHLTAELSATDYSENEVNGEAHEDISKKLGADWRHEDVAGKHAWIRRDGDNTNQFDISFSGKPEADIVVELTASNEEEIIKVRDADNLVDYKKWLKSHPISKLDSVQAQSADLDIDLIDPTEYVQREANVKVLEAIVASPDEKISWKAEGALGYVREGLNERLIEAKLDDGQIAQLAEDEEILIDNWRFRQHGDDMVFKPHTRDGLESELWFTRSDSNVRYALSAEGELKALTPVAVLVDGLPNKGVSDIYEYDNEPYGRRGLPLTKAEDGCYKYESGSPDSSSGDGNLVKAGDGGNYHTITHGRTGMSWSSAAGQGVLEADRQYLTRDNGNYIAVFKNDGVSKELIGEYYKGNKWGNTSLTVESGRIEIGGESVLDDLESGGLDQAFEDIEAAIIPAERELAATKEQLDYYLGDQSRMEGAWHDTTVESKQPIEKGLGSIYTHLKSHPDAQASLAKGDVVTIPVSGTGNSSLDADWSVIMKDKSIYFENPDNDAIWNEVHSGDWHMRDGEEMTEVKYMDEALGGEERMSLYEPVEDEPILFTRSGDKLVLSEKNYYKGSIGADSREIKVGIGANGDPAILKPAEGGGLEWQTPTRDITHTVTKSDHTVYLESQGADSYLIIGEKVSGDVWRPQDDILAGIRDGDRSSTLNLKPEGDRNLDGITLEPFEESTSATEGAEVVFSGEGRADTVEVVEDGGSTHVDADRVETSTALETMREGMVESYYKAGSWDKSFIDILKVVAEKSGIQPEDRTVLEGLGKDVYYERLAERLADGLFRSDGSTKPLDNADNVLTAAMKNFLGAADRDTILGDWFDSKKTLVFNRIVEFNETLGKVKK